MLSSNNTNKPGLSYKNALKDDVSNKTTSDSSTASTIVVVLLFLTIESISPKNIPLVNG